MNTPDASFQLDCLENAHVVVCNCLQNPHIFGETALKDSLLERKRALKELDNIKRTLKPRQREKLVSLKYDILYTRNTDLPFH